MLAAHSQMWHYFYPNLYGCAPGVPWVSKNCNFVFLQMKLLSSCARIELKLRKLWKTVKIEKKNVKNACFLTVFQTFCNLGSIFVHQISTSLFSGWWHIFWHPWGPWGRIHSKDIMAAVLWQLRFDSCHAVKLSTIVQSEPVSVDLRVSRISAI